MEETRYLIIDGMHCPACVTRIEKVVSKIDGVKEINVNLTTEKARVMFNNNRTSISNIIQSIQAIGFKANMFEDNNERHHTKQKNIIVLQWKFIFSALLTIPLAWAMFAHFDWAAFIYIPDLFTNPLFQFSITVPIQFIIGFHFYEQAWKAIKSGYVNMDVLVVLSTSTAFFYSHYLTFTSLQILEYTPSIVLYYETSAFIITFILLGQLLEAKIKKRTTQAIKNLYHLQTKSATIYKNGKTSQIPVDQLTPGDVIMLRPGEKVPIDGQVIQGSSMINESLLTGESTPIEKGPSDSVYAGTLNHHGVLKIQVTKQVSETVLSHIIRIVEEAQASKAPIQRIADKVVGFFVPIVIFIAGVTFVLWYTTLQPGNISAAVAKVIAVLIIACPCALGLATPTSVMVGSGRAAQLGILFKEGKFLELLSDCKTVIFDKTGTLTKGIPLVTDIYVEQLSHNTFLEMIGAVENNSEHPIASAIVKKAKMNTPSLPPAQNVVALPGHGVKGFVNGDKVIIANPRYFKQNNHLLPSKADQIIINLEQEGKTVMIVFINSRFSGIVAVADTIKPSSIVAVSRLKQMGLHLIMLTGDNYKAGMHIAQKAGINTIQSEVSPQDKVKVIHQIQKVGEKVVMVGDGMNDAPALAVANIGVAMGTGSDIAIESGDVTIIKGDLNRFVDAITISKKTMINIKQNLVWAFFYNIIMIPFAMFGFLAPWLAGAAMAFSSISVVLNALRLNRMSL